MMRYPEIRFAITVAIVLLAFFGVIITGVNLIPSPVRAQQAGWVRTPSGLEYTDIEGVRCYRMRYATELSCVKP